MDEAELMDKLRRHMADVRYLYPDLSAEKVEQKAIIRLGAELSNLLRAVRDAVKLRGVLVGIEERRDMWGRIIRIAMEKWNENRNEAIKMGYTDEEGHPLDWRKEVGGQPNPRYGERIASVWTRTVYLVGRINDEEEDSLVRLECRGDMVDFAWSLGQAYSMLVREVDAFRGLRTCRTFRVTNPRQVSGPSMYEIFSGAPEELTTTPIDIDEWLGDAETKIGIIRGDVLRIAPVERGGWVIFLGDVLEDVEFEGIPFYCPAILPQPEEGHRILTLARIRYRLDVGRWANVILGWCEA